MRELALGLRRACSMCGYPMPRGKPVYHVFTTSPQQHLHSAHGGGVVTHPSPGPMHRSCAAYSTASCPFLKYRQSRRRSARHVTRGDAEIVGFENFGMVFFAEPTRRGDLREWGYLGQCEGVPYASWKDMARMYDAMIAADAKVIDTSKPRLYWTDSDLDRGRLMECARIDRVRLLQLRGSIPAVVGNGYRMALL
ncbi:hypothetical protein [Mycobacterium terramassiliense]|uniref:hypothetical protein n=1 Tax=Mycobacterium terramassiliense TaxID=1841859 RepID=UPI0012FFC094|nr:hypothetical protein [Mycobacterium terramassiliense]